MKIFRSVFEDTWPETCSRIASAISAGASVSNQRLRVQIFRGVLFQAIANVTSQCGSLAGLLVAARLLGREQYGRYALIQSTVNTFVAVAALGLGVTATKYVSEYRSADPERAGRILGLCSAVALFGGVLFSTIYLAGFGVLLKNISGATAQLGAVCILFTTLTGYQAGALAGFEAFRITAIINICAAVANPFLTFVLTKTSGLTGTVAGLGIDALITWMLYQRALRSECRRWKCALSFRNLRADKALLASMSLPAAISSLVASTATWLSVICLSRQANGFSQVAIYSVASSVRLGVLFMPAVLARVMLPILNAERSTAGLHRFRQGFRAFVLLTFVAAAIPAMFAVVFQKSIFNLFGKDFIDADHVVIVLVLAAILEAVAGSLSQMLIISARMWVQASIMFLWSLALVGCAWSAIHAGARGLADANLISWGAVTCAYMYGVRRLNKAGLTACS